MVDGRKNHKSHPYEETKNTIDNGRQLEREKICVLRYGEEKKYCKRHEERSKCAPRRRRGKEALKNVPSSHSIRMKRCVRDENSRRKYDLTWRGSGVNREKKREPKQSEPSQVKTKVQQKQTKQKGKGTRTLVRYTIGTTAGRPLTETNVFIRKNQEARRKSRTERVRFGIGGEGSRKRLRSRGWRPVAPHSPLGTLPLLARGAHAVAAVAATAGLGCCRKGG
ncbi:hypothetical protein V1477_000865, partial [Vespula maculifrons]